MTTTANTCEQAKVAAPRRARLCLGVLAVLAASFAAGAAQSAPLPAPIQLMIETAIANEDAATVTAVLKVARKAAPDSLSEIDRLETAYRNRLAAAKAESHRQAQRRLAEAGPLDRWTCGKARPNSAAANRPAAATTSRFMPD
jgi:hypothetical protein